MMDIANALKQGTEQLKSCSSSPSLDASLLLAYSMSGHREQLYSWPQRLLSERQEKFYSSLLNQRTKGFSVAYLVGEKEFYDHSFAVGQGVLVPRADSELLVDLILQQENTQTVLRVHESCCGSGCVAISLALARPRWKISMSDVSPLALHYALYNQKRYKLSLPCFQSHLLPQTKECFDILIANPPYLTTLEYEERHKEGWKEPQLALEAGDDGLKLLNKLICKAPEHLNEEGQLFLEACPSLMPQLQQHFEQKKWRDIRIYKDLAQQERVMQAKRPLE